MREMSRQEMLDFVAEWKWGTVIGVEGDRPYAIEVAYASDDKYLYCGSRPGGRMAHCVLANANAAFKICDSDPNHQKWRAVIIEGKAERLTEKQDVLYFIRLLAKKMGRSEHAFDALADKIMEQAETSNTLRIPLVVMSGRTNWP